MIVVADALQASPRGSKGGVVGAGRVKDWEGAAIYRTWRGMGGTRMNVDGLEMSRLMFNEGGEFQDHQTTNGCDRGGCCC